jgi:hypothetical protein
VAVKADISPGGRSLIVIYEYTGLISGILRRRQKGVPPLSRKSRPLVAFPSLPTRSILGVSPTINPRW